MTDITPKQIISFILQMIRPFIGSIIVMFAVATAWAIDLSVRPYLLKIILDKLAESPFQQTFQHLLIPLSAYLFMSLFMGSMHRMYGYFVEIKMIPNLRLKISEYSFETLLHQSHTYYQNQFSGSLVNKVGDLTWRIPEIIQIIIDRFFSHFLALAIAIFTLWQVSSKFALTMLIWVSLFVSVSLIVTKKLAHLTEVLSERSSTITGKMVDAISNILSIRLFARKAKERLFMQQTVMEAVEAEQHLEWAYFWVWCFYAYSFVIMLGFSIYFLLRGRQEGTVSMGDFALVLSINGAIVDFLWNLTKDFTEFTKELGRVTQALRTLLVVPEIQDKPQAKPLVVTKGEIIFDHVQFHYKEATALFEQESVTIPPGQKVGLVGYSGSGKTTFVNLILRVFDVTGGRILIDRQDIRDVTQESLRENIGMIPQDPSLFHRSLRENIRYGRLHATDEEVIEAAKKAHAHDFIMALPDQYDSLVGERGVKLSGGQRQRIAIARAILKNAPILILDEATSQLDSITESFIQESLWENMEGKTTLVIAHRLSTLLHMDRILVFEKGKIIEDGSHKDLLSKKGAYKTLWNAQVGGFLPGKREIDRP